MDSKQNKGEASIASLYPFAFRKLLKIHPLSFASSLRGATKSSFYQKLKSWLLVRVYDSITNRFDDQRED